MELGPSAPAGLFASGKRRRFLQKELHMAMVMDDGRVDVSLLTWSQS